MGTTDDDVDDDNVDNDVDGPVCHMQYWLKYPRGRSLSVRIYDDGFYVARPRDSSDAALHPTNLRKRISQ